MTTCHNPISNAVVSISLSILFWQIILPIVWKVAWQNIFHRYSSTVVVLVMLIVYCIGVGAWRPVWQLVQPWCSGSRRREVKFKHQLLLSIAVSPFIGQTQKHRGEDTQWRQDQTWNSCCVSSSSENTVLLVWLKLLTGGVTCTCVHLPPFPSKLRPGGPWWDLVGTKKCTITFQTHHHHHLAELGDNDFWCTAKRRSSLPQAALK